jgi:hypothetical protein
MDSPRPHRRTRVLGVRTKLSETKKKTVMSMQAVGEHQNGT